METKQQVIERIQQERSHWKALLAEIGEERMTQPGAMGDWNFKDTVAHLISWWQWEMARLEAARHGEGPPYDPPEQEVQVINEWTYTLNKHRPLATILHEAETLWQQLEDIVQRLPEQDLTEPGRFAWLNGKSLASGILFGFFNHLHEEHEPLIRAWLNNQ